MENRYENGTLRWSFYLIVGFLSFLFLSSIFIEVLLYKYSVWIKPPLALLFSAILLYLYKRYLLKYAHFNDSISTCKKLYTLPIGWGVAAILFGTIVPVLFLVKVYTIRNYNLNFTSQVEGLSLFLLVAISEEIASRGILYRLLSDRWNPSIALIVSSLLFGFMHLFNTGGTAWSSLSIALTAGWLLGISYAYHRTIWVPIGMHWAWNYLESCVFGFPVSGNPITFIPIVTPIVSGPDILTGGAFGLEASIITVIIAIIIAAAYTALYFKKMKVNSKSENEITLMF